MSKFIQIIGPYSNVIKGILILIFIYIFASIAYDFYKKWKSDNVEKTKIENKTKLTAEDIQKVSVSDRAKVIKQIVAPDGVDPSPNSYMSISDGGREVYVRMVTLSKLPKKVRYAETLRPLLDFPNCSCTVFVEPISNEEIGRKIDRQINLLEAEEIVNRGNTNRVRKLGSQVDEVTEWADRLETGDKKFFNVGFLFNFVADTVEELNRITDNFRSKALNGKMDISNCYAVQCEAFLSTLPLNRRHRAVFGKLNSDCVKMHLMDEGAVSVVLNYTTDYFTHKSGVPLGRNIFNGMPFVFDLFHPSHDGMTMVIAGKTGSGKSTVMKVMVERSIPRGVRYIIIDSQARKGTSEGEYTSLCEINGGVSYQISSSVNNTLNIFDLQESTEFIKTGVDEGYERKTLDLNSSIADMVFNLRSMMRIGSDAEDAKLDAILESDIDELLRKVVKDMFADRGIYHGDADSLYTQADIVEDGMLQSGFVPKELPTITECYIRLLEERVANTDAQVEKALRLILNNLKEYVRELYYSEDSITVFTKEEFFALPEHPEKRGVRIYAHGNMEENVFELRGIRPYFDGQSTFAINRNCPITSIDISQLTEIERKVAREIAIRFVNEQYIKKNSESLSSADQLVVLVDEAHESFENEYGRKVFSNVVRTARKRNCGVIFASQTCKEFDLYPETQAILKQAAVKMIFKQDGSDNEHLQKALNITPSQASVITNMLGVVVDKDNPEEKNKHRGECCVIDGEQVLFIKVDYLRNTEGLAVETDASTVIQSLNAR